jgi:hypothetical protein
VLRAIAGALGGQTTRERLQRGRTHAHGGHVHDHEHENERH